VSAGLKICPNRATRSRVLKGMETKTTPGTRLIIREAKSGELLIDADNGNFQEIEGNWYVDASALRTSHLVTTSHEYTCPYKGRCFYVDYDDGERKVSRVAWIYHDVKDGWGHIAGKYGFYAGETARTFGKTSDSIK
jgi:uncharacterized protein (DUF427 family)